MRGTPAKVFLEQGINTVCNTAEVVQHSPYLVWRQGIRRNISDGINGVVYREEPHQMGIGIHLVQASRQFCTLPAVM